MTNSDTFVGNFKETLNKFANSINIGDQFWLSQDNIAIEKDGDLPRFMKFTVIKKYKYVVLLEKPCAKGQIHRQSLSYNQLYFATNGG